MANNISSKTVSPVKGLKESFAKQRIAFTNRASAVFPVYLRNKTDLHIVFLNYWTIKNNIPANGLSINIKIYDDLGNLLIVHVLEEIEDHNQISIRAILNDKKELDLDKLDGTAHIEIISTHNLRFSFPAIIGIYQAENLFSAVHSAGRVKNSDELQKISYTEETNWICKNNEQTTPFFHFFNGPQLPTKKNILVYLDKSSDNNLISTKEIDISNIPELGSKFFTADNLFSKSDLKNECYISVKVEHNCIFPRLVVGNLYKENNFLEATHSFPIIKNIDHIKSDEKPITYKALLCGFTSKELSLDMSVFPTNCEGEFQADFLTQKYNEDKIKAIGNSEYFDKKKLKQMQTFKLDNQEQFLEIGLTGESVPSRINASFIYRVKDKAGPDYTTNIANGAVSHVFPPRHRQWGHGYLGNNFETNIHIRNTSHNPDDTKDGNGTIIFYGKNMKIVHKFKIKAESSLAISLSDIISKDNINAYDDNNFISWMMEIDIPNCDSHWVSFRKSDGAIFGEHSF